MLNTLLDTDILKIAIFELPELNSSNFSVLTDSEPISSDEPTGVDAPTLDRIVSLGYQPYNLYVDSQWFDINQLIQEERNNISGDRKLLVFSLLNRDKRMNVLKSDQVILDNYFQNNLVIVKDLDLVDFLPSNSLNSETEVKFIFFNRQIGQEGNQEQWKVSILDKNFQELELISAANRANNAETAGLFTTVTGDVDYVAIYNIDGTNGILRMSQDDDFSIKDAEVTLFNKISSILSENFTFNEGVIASYDEKLRLPTNELQFSFRIPAIRNDVIESINKRINAGRRFGFVVYKEGSFASIFKDIGLSYLILDSDNDNVREWGYIDSTSQSDISAISGLSLKGKKTILYNPPTVFFKRWELLFSTEFANNINYSTNIGGAGSATLTGQNTSDIIVEGEKDTNQVFEIEFIPFTTITETGLYAFTFDLTNMEAFSGADVPGELNVIMGDNNAQSSVNLLTHTSLQPFQFGNPAAYNFKSITVNITDLGSAFLQIVNGSPLPYLVSFLPFGVTPNGGIALRNCSLYKVQD